MSRKEELERLVDRAAGDRGGDACTGLGVFYCGSAAHVTEREFRPFRNLGLLFPPRISKYVTVP